MAADLSAGVLTAKDRAQLDRIEAKLNALGQAIGGPALKRRWASAERDLPASRRTFTPTGRHREPKGA